MKKSGSKNGFKCMIIRDILCTDCKSALAGVNIATMYIGTKFGGWYGAGAALFYIGVKANVQYQMNNGLNPGNLYIINKE